MSQQVTILYICDSCRKIRQFTFSKESLDQENSLYKVKDTHANHEIILYLIHQYFLERILNNPPVPRLDEPIIKRPTTEYTKTESKVPKNYKDLSEFLDLKIKTINPKRVIDEL